MYQEAQKRAAQYQSDLNAALLNLQQTNSKLVEQEGKKKNFFW